MIQANEMLKSLEEKHKPVDPDVLEQHQQQHQILPPKEKPDLENYHKDSNIEGNPPQVNKKLLPYLVCCVHARRSRGNGKILTHYQTINF